MRLFPKYGVFFQASGNLEGNSLVAEEFSDSDGNRLHCLKEREEFFLPVIDPVAFKNYFYFVPKIFCSNIFHQIIRLCK